MQIKSLCVAVSVAAAFGLSACGGSGGTGSTGADEKKTATAVKLPSGKDTLIIANGSEPPTLDPTKSQDTTSSAIIRQMFEGLVSTDKEGKTVPGLAKSWQSDDNKVWIFTLRDANWSNGEPITAHDAVFAFQRLTDPNTAAPYGTYLADAKVLNADKVATGKLPVSELGVKALDDKTLQITLSEAVPYFVDMLALPVVYPVPKSVVEKYGDKWLDINNLVVSGAYKLSEWSVNSHVTLQRNQAYYDNAKTSIEKVQFLPITSSNGMNRYYAGELDVNGVPPELIEKVRKEMPEQMITSPSLCSFYLEPNVTAKPLDDVRVRQALSMALERELIPGILKRDTPVGYQFTPLATQGALVSDPAWRSLDRKQLNEQALALLSEAGFSANNPLKFELMYSTSEVGKMLANAFVSMWKQNLGNVISVELVNQEWKTFLDTKNQGKFTIASAGWCADYNEPSTFLNILTTGNGNNSGRYTNPMYDQLLANTLKPGLSGDDRAKLYQQAEAVIAKDVALIPLYHSVSILLVKPYVNGFSDKNPLGDYLVKDLFFKQD